jgi:hypothetical protein
MQDNLMQTAIQPFLKLGQANMELLTQFSLSPQALSQSFANVQNLFQPGQAPAANLLQSNAFAQLAQGLLKNYTEFMLELGQSSLAVINQGQAQMMGRAQDAAESVIDVSETSDTRGRRARQAA